jgi:hypothetical protein
MTDDPLATIFSLVERVYMRMQAGDLLIRCLDEGTYAPVQEMVEGLVIAGPENLDALREILAEATQRKSQVKDDMNQIFADMKKVLGSYGVKLVGMETAFAIIRVRPIGFLGVMKEQGVEDIETQTACLQLLKDSQDLLSNLSYHLHLLDEVEEYLKDWIWGMAYQLAHQEIASAYLAFTEIDQ